jgi:hypothetical protein
VVEEARALKLLSGEHFTVDGTLIEAWASPKSFRRKGAESSNRADDDAGNPTVTSTANAALTKLISRPLTRRRC